ncbi:hypothetical protein J4573_14740 [Actinomadura barringtoniae]|uniref:DUF8094 domain-containing protein n=1 Tax=Actinomadura barringtoniae TaxID=1427535 RepID=A0A939T4K7_9ACTN|nr:hypothetical protein [Actinomadura barringtoniae]MBO2448359.1 hypothetical protein [Actinomadura barringtoniae]
MRRTTLAACAAVLLAVTPAVASCAGQESKARPRAALTTVAPSPEPLTPQLAESQFRSFVGNDDVARAARDERLALNWVSDGQAMLTAAEFRKAAFDGDPVQRFDYGTPKFYVPKLKEEFPQWFVAQVPRTVKGDPKSTRTALMGFIRKGSTDTWHLSLSTLLAPKAKMPKIAVGPDGYATGVTPDDTSVLIGPQQVPGIHATLAFEGPDSVTARIMKNGPYTTGYYNQSRKDHRKALSRGLILQTVFVATPWPLFPLRTEHGGVTVLYSLSRNTNTQPKDKDKAKGLNPPLPPEIAHLLENGVEGPQIQTSETLQFVAFDPAKSTDKSKEQSKAEVFGEDGAFTKASAPPKAS